jgi:hypothetical protein
MLDWYSGLIGYDASNMKLGVIYEVDPDGVKIWSVEPWKKAKGSYESSVQVKRDSSTKEMRRDAEEWIEEAEMYGEDPGKACPPVVLQMSGNPVKFLQGHNVFGPSVKQISEVLQAFVRGLPAELRPRDADVEGLPVRYNSRLDINVMVDLGSHGIVHDWLEHAQRESSTGHKHKVEGFGGGNYRSGLTGGKTVVWGPKSRHWSMKAYCKLCELEKHKPVDGKLYGFAKEFVESTVRIELTLRRPEIKKLESDEVYKVLGMDESIVWEFMEKIKFSVMQANVVDSKADLKPAVENVLTLWLGGYDVKNHMPRRTFYDYRRRILEQVGVDISLSPFDGKVVEKAKFDLDYLKGHEVKDIPKHLEKWLFKPGGERV